MAKNKTAKSEAATQETVAQTTTETVKGETVVEAVKAEAAPVAEKAAEPVKAEATVVEKVAEAVKAEAVKAEAVVEKVAGVVKAEAARAETVVTEAAGAVKAEAARAETVVTEAAGQVATFVKGRLEQAQKQFGQLESEAQKALQTLVTRGRESGRVVLQRLNVNELREKPAVKELEKKATWVGGEVRQRITGLQTRMVQVVGGVARQEQVQAINRELDRLTRKLDSLVSNKKPEQQQPQQETPKA
jgi:tetrahydromethanopterin S-methyltransferase subunit G